MGFPRQENWSGSPFSSPRNLSTSGIKPTSPALTLRFFPSEPPGKPGVYSASGYYLFLIISFSLKSSLSCHLPSPLCGSCALRNPQRKKKNPSFRSNGKNFELFFAILPRPFSFVAWHRLPLHAASVSSLLDTLWSFLLRRVSIHSRSSSTAWRPPLDFIFSMLILAEAPILNCQCYLCHCQVCTSHTASLSS